ncbi:MAG: PH domain-containing protein [Bacillota bacterium]
MSFEFGIAHWDRTAHVVTVISLLIAVGITLLLGPLIYLLKEGKLFPVLALPLIWGPIILAYLLAPRRYSVAPEGITVRRVIDRGFLIPISEIKSVQTVENITPPRMKFWASAGLFGWFGHYVLENGDVSGVHATRWDSMVKVETHRGIHLLSPVAPESFCRVAELFIGHRRVVQKQIVFPPCELTGPKPEM